MSEIRISITDDDFRRLVAGEIVPKVIHGAPFGAPPVLLALQDIGFNRMFDAILDAKLELEKARRV